LAAAITNMTAANGGAEEMETKTDAPGVSGPTSLDELQHLLARAQRGDLAVLPQLRQVLNERSDIWQHYGDLAWQAEGALIKLIAGKDLLLSESLVRKQAHLKASLAGPSSGSLERALVERVAACSLQVSYFDALFAGAKGTELRQTDALRRHQDSAHRRYLSAVKTLATVRKLLQPSVSPIQIASTLHARTERRMQPRQTMATVGTGTEN